MFSWDSNVIWELIGGKVVVMCNIYTVKILYLLENNINHIVALDIAAALKNNSWFMEKE